MAASAVSEMCQSAGKNLHSCRLSIIYWICRPLKLQFPKLMRISGMVF